jgi:hypothetical protein
MKEKSKVHLDEPWPGSTRSDERGFCREPRMIWIAYLIRHDVVNAENETNLVEIC